MEDNGASMTYAALDAFANQLGYLFRSLGLSYGDHVTFCVENRLECPALQWGAHYAGLYYTFLSTRLTASEIGYIAADCDAKLMVVGDKTNTLPNYQTREIAGFVAGSMSNGSNASTIILDHEVEGNFLVVARDERRTKLFSSIAQSIAQMPLGVSYGHDL